MTVQELFDQILKQLPKKHWRKTQLEITGLYSSKADDITIRVEDFHKKCGTCGHDQGTVKKLTLETDICTG